MCKIDHFFSFYFALTNASALISISLYKRSIPSFLIVVEILIQYLSVDNVVPFYANSFKWKENMSSQSNTRIKLSKISHGIKL